MFVIKKMEGGQGAAEEWPKGVGSRPNFALLGGWQTALCQSRLCSGNWFLFVWLGARAFPDLGVREARNVPLGAALPLRWLFCLTIISQSSAPYSGMSAEIPCSW